MQAAPSLRPVNLGQHLRAPIGTWRHIGGGESRDLDLPRERFAEILWGRGKGQDEPVSPSPTEPRSCPRGCCYTTPDRFTAYCLEVGKAGSYPSISPSPTEAKAPASVVAHPAAAGRGEGTRVSHAQVYCYRTSCSVLRRGVDRPGSVPAALMRVAATNVLAGGLRDGL